MCSLNKKRKAKNRAKTTGANDRCYLDNKDKDAKYGMYNASLRKSLKQF